MSLFRSTMLIFAMVSVVSECAKAATTAQTLQHAEAVVEVTSEGWMDMVRQTRLYRLQMLEVCALYGLLVASLVVDERILAFLSALVLPCFMASICRRRNELQDIRVYLQTVRFTSS